ncbi:7-alpha-hydroxysteroid dehydrogenase [Escherichia coli]|nr:7-alpha-hydroxysteroid dehydrogenase [Escherichia coli]
MFNSDNLRLDGKCAIITGAGAGIGKEIAITFATAGASVVVSDINADAANHVVDEIQQLGGQAFACRCDITSEQELSALADFAVSKLGKVDILVNNAGGGGPKPFDMPMADFRRAYELNVFSFFHLSQLVAPEMEKNGGGVILTITSMAAENKNINMTSYASSKAAASHLVRNMAFDLGEKNIRVNGIAPGAILTDALKSVIKNKHMTITEFVAQRMRDAQQKGEISPDINTSMTSRLLLDLTYGVLADIEAEDLAREASFAQGLRAMIGGILTAS